MRPHFTLPIMALITTLVGCTGASPQSFEGQLGAGWEQRPVTVRAVDGGRIVSAPIGADGRFSITVPGQQEYRFELVRADGTTVPVVFARDAGRATESLRVYGGTAPFDLGHVARVAPYRSRQEAMTRMPLPEPMTLPGSVGMSRQLLSAPVASAPADTATAGEDSGEDDEVGEVETCDDDEGESDDDDDEVEQEGEYEDGDGMEADDGTEIELEEAGVVEHSPPSGIGRCDDEDDDDDEVEQEGEHEG